MNVVMRIFGMLILASVFVPQLSGQNITTGEVKYVLKHYEIVDSTLAREVTFHSIQDRLYFT